MRYAARVALLASMIAIAPLRAEPTGGQANAQSTTRDPNEKVCENIVQVGSRIAAKRFCGTRAEWEARQKQDRDVVDGAQRAAAAPCQAVMTHSGTPNCG